MLPSIALDDLETGVKYRFTLVSGLHVSGCFAGFERDEETGVWIITVTQFSKGYRGILPVPTQEIDHVARCDD